MDESVRTDNGQYEKYEELLLKRDRVVKEAESINIAYLREFGDLMIELIGLMIECIKKEKMISCCENLISLGEEIYVEDIQPMIDIFVADYDAELQDMIRDKEIADRSTTTPPDKVERAKWIYGKLAMALHPDFNNLTLENEEFHALWERIVAAYRANDDDELINLVYTVRDMLIENGEELEVPEINDLDERIADLEAEINEVITSEPYTYLELLMSPERTAEKKHILHQLIDEQKEYSSELTTTLDDLLSEGGSSITWSRV